VLHGFVFTYDQVCPEDYEVIGSMDKTHKSHGFGVYSHVFGVCPRVQYGMQTPRSESSNYAIEGQDQNKAITDHVLP